MPIYTFDGPRTALFEIVPGGDLEFLMVSATREDAKEFESAVLRRCGSLPAGSGTRQHR